MEKQFLRTEILYGKNNIEKIKTKKVAIFGIGGVGGYVVEALARSGVSNFLLVDNDVVDVTNLNRQIISTNKNIGAYKVLEAKERILSINANANVEVNKCFYLPETAHEFDFSKYDYVVDCVDTVTAKINLVVEANKAGVPVISAMGAGNKVKPEMLEVADIYKTSVDPLARVMRYELKKRGIKKLKVVYSKEEPLDINYNEEGSNRRNIPASNAFVPSVMGIIIASEVFKDLIGSE